MIQMKNIAKNLSKACAKKYLTKASAIAYLISTEYVVACFAIIIFRIGAPYHRHIAITIYLISWVVYIWPLAKILDRKRIEKSRGMKYMRSHKSRIAMGAISAMIIYLMVIMFPGINTQYLSIDEEDLGRKIATDEKYLLHTIKSLNNLSGKYAPLTLATIDPETVDENGAEMVTKIKMYWGGGSGSSHDTGSNSGRI